jgi:predicted nucleic acid-binding protein
MKFWDASALVPLLAAQPATAAMQALYLRDDGALTWWATEIECVSALCRLERLGGIGGAAATEAMDRLRELASSWHEVEPGDAVREAARRFLRVHDLRAADALQLAAAFVASEGRPSTLEIVSLDDRLSLAATREGFPVLGRPGKNA